MLSTEWLLDWKKMQPAFGPSQYLMMLPRIELWKESSVRFWHSSFLKMFLIKLTCPWMPWTKVTQNPGKDASLGGVFVVFINDRLNPDGYHWGVYSGMLLFLTSLGYSVKESRKFLSLGEWRIERALPLPLNKSNAEQTAWIFLLWNLKKELPSPKGVFLNAASSSWSITLPICIET